VSLDVARYGLTIAGRLGSWYNRKSHSLLLVSVITVSMAQPPAVTIAFSRSRFPACSAAAILG
jgi:hypothetical protein